MEGHDKMTIDYLEKKPGSRPSSPNQTVKTNHDGGRDIIATTRSDTRNRDSARGMNRAGVDTILPKIQSRSELIQSRHSNSEMQSEDSKSGPSNIVLDQESQQRVEQEEEKEEVDLMKSKCIDCSLKNVVLSLAFLCLVITAITLFFIYNSEIKGFADDYIRFMKDEPFLAILLYMLAYIGTRPICIPATLFILFGAYIFGEAFGFLAGFFIFVVVDYISLLVGTSLAFLNGRYLFKNCVQSMIKKRKKLMALSEALSHNAKKLVFLLRICSLTPYYIFNYVCSVTNMSWTDYFIGNLGIILCDAPYIYVCASISDISEVEDSSSNLGVWYYVIIAISILIVIVVIILVYFLAKKELARTLELIKNEQKENEDNNNQSSQRDGDGEQIPQNPYISPNLPSVALKTNTSQHGQSLKRDQSSRRDQSSVTPVNGNMRYDEEED
ncbi:unnamed protein product [Moneuplotes crassus]|uniref:VTT domain-containing protein n=1 Tax=Euplotes crassus TaxID=5936 RepID=A0AAD1UDE3_EUPCR|nr:unnamed protein product [Moneuplotes crassus]